MRNIPHFGIPRKVSRPNTQGVASRLHTRNTTSLTGGSAASLDGESFDIPEDSSYGEDISMSSVGAGSIVAPVYSDGGGVVKDEPNILGPNEYYSNFGDDVSSLCSTNIGAGNNSAYGATSGVPVYSEGLEMPKEPSIVGYDDNNLGRKGENKDIAIAAGARAGGGCMPDWLADASLKIKLLVVLSAALLVGSIVVAAVAAALVRGRDSSGESNSGNRVSATGTEESRTNFTLSPSPSPIGVPTLGPGGPTPNNTVTPSQSPSTIEPAPSPIPTPSPTQKLTVEPTTPASSPIPTNLPTTQTPTQRPTTSSTDSPTRTSTNYPSSSPTGYPTTTPTGNLTPPPTDSTTTFKSSTTFYVFGDQTTGDDADQLPSLLASLESEYNGDEEGSFFVHLGDWNPSTNTECSEDDYRAFNTLYSSCSVPVLLVPGDNEYNDCDNPGQAWQYWASNLLNYEYQHWNPPFQVIRQDGHLENFAFAFRGILYMGLNLVGGTVYDEQEWIDRTLAALTWVNDNVQMYSSSVEAAMIFAHTGPDDTSNAELYLQLVTNVRNVYSFPFIIFSKERNGVGWTVERRWNDIENLHVVRVRGEQWPPMVVEVNTEENSLLINQGGSGRKLRMKIQQ